MAEPADSPTPGRTIVPETKRRGISGFVHLLGPGLITGASDDDPSGIGTYSQVGSQFGYGLLWLALFTFPLMSAVQELCARIALQTGVGLGASLRRKFPRWLVGIAILGLLAANTFNVGADLGAVAAAGSLLSRGALHALWLVVPVALLIIGMQVFATYATIFKIFKWLTLALFAYVVTAFFAHPPLLEVVRATVVPHVEFSKDFVVALVAVLGTTISPYLFFWQASSEVDELAQADAANPERGRRGLRLSELRAARTDVVIGMAFSNLVMYFIILTAAATLHAHGKTTISTARDAAEALRPLAGDGAYWLFSLGLIGAGMLGVPVLAGSCAYAIAEAADWVASLDVHPPLAHGFYAVIAIAMALGLGLDYAGLNAVKMLFWAAVANGVLAPPLIVVLVLATSNVKIMGNSVNPPVLRWLGWLTAALMALAAIAMFITLK